MAINVEEDDAGFLLRWIGRAITLSYVMPKDGVGSAVVYHSRSHPVARCLRAFSLIELLVSVSIIGLLMAIMLPALKQSLIQARSTVCMHNLRSLDQVLQMYRLENQGWLPSIASDSTPGQAGRSEGRSKNKDSKRPETWFSRLAPRYLNSLGVLLCPDDPYASYLEVAHPNKPSPISDRVASYGMNDFIFSSPGSKLAHVDRYPPKRPADTLLIADMGPDAGYAVHGYDPSDPKDKKRRQGRLGWSDGFQYGSVNQYVSWLTQRHSRGINVLTLNGAVRHVSTKEPMKRAIRPYYDRCAAGACTFCLELNSAHYTFYRSQTYWWTGSVPSFR